MHKQQNPDAPAFARWLDLAQGGLGGLPIHANDEFFAEKENLVQPGPAVFVDGKYTDRGKWMDGWESRRKRVPGHDWCVLRLGLPGELKGFDIDTSFFVGNYPPFASVDGVLTDERLTVHSDFAKLAWQEILPKSPLGPGRSNFFAAGAAAAGKRFSHLRLNIYPDGGVARFRAYGKAVPDWSKLGPGDVVDLAAVEYGGSVEACNDMFFGMKDALIMPGRGINMGDGWETRRKRELPGHDWCVVRLGKAGRIQRVIIDTNNFKGNYPDRASLEACYAPGAKDGEVPASGWQPLLAETPLGGHRQHEYLRELKAAGPFTHVRLNIFPDGGVARLRVLGTVAE
jgi:allantoicase